MADRMNIAPVQQQLVKALEQLEQAGLAVDAALVVVERRHAVEGGDNELEKQSLAAASREVWRGHASTMKTMEALRQLQQHYTAPKGPDA